MKLVVIGGGPGGYTAAIRAAQLGADVTVIEKDKLGGTCLNRGCIPTKALLACADALTVINDASEFGIDINGKASPNIQKMVERKNEIVTQLRNGIEYIFKNYNIKLVNAAGKLIKQNDNILVGAGDELIECDSVIIATGSQPAKLPGFDFSQPAVLTSDDILDLTEIPEKLLILGGGVVGCEFASLYSRLGSDVTIVEMMPQLLPFEERRIAKQLESAFRKSGIKVMTKTSIDEVVEYGSSHIKVKLSSGEIAEASKLLVSVGRKLLSEEAGLKEAGVGLTERGATIVNEKMETSIKGIYAVGDINGGIMLAHWAAAEGVVAVQNACGKETAIDRSVIPNCIFTAPEIATVGLNSDKAKEKGIDIKTGRFPFAANGKAHAIGETEGSVTIIADAGSDKILGGQIIGPHASDLIHEIALAVKLGITAKQIGETIHAHPTLPEAVLEAAESIHGRAIHIVAK